jgi:hypothetical protein
MIYDQVGPRGHEARLPSGEGEFLSATAASDLWNRAAAALARRDYPEFDRLISLFRMQAAPEGAT